MVWYGMESRLLVGSFPLYVPPSPPLLFASPFVLASRPQRRTGLNGTELCCYAVVIAALGRYHTRATSLSDALDPPRPVPPLASACGAARFVRASVTRSAVLGHVRFFRIVPSFCRIASKNTSFSSMLVENVGGFGGFLGGFFGEICIAFSDIW